MLLAHGVVVKDHSNYVAEVAIFVYFWHFDLNSGKLSLQQGNKTISYLDIRFIPQEVTMPDYTDAYHLAKVFAITIARKYNVDIDDAISDGYLAVSERISRFDPEKAKLQTYIYMVVSRQIITTLRSRKVRACVKSNSDEVCGNTAACPEGSSDDDSSVVVRLALDLAASGKKHKTIRKSVETALVEAGWGKNRIAEAFDSVLEGV